MTQARLYKELDYVDHSRKKRDHYASLLIEQPSLLQPLLEILFMVDDKQSPKAGWLIEFATKNNLSLLFPYLDDFISKMHTVYQDPALRPVAKICERLTLSYYKEQHPLSQKALQPKHKEQMINAGFDWLITDQKVAVKAYTLTTLYHLGTEIDWVHPELLIIMENQYPTSSAAFQARTRHVTGWIKKHRTRFSNH